jgi:hypothetical protein
VCDTHVHNRHTTHRVEPISCDNMVDDTTFRLSFLVASLFGVYLFASWYRRDPLLDAIPAVGFSDPILSYLSALRFHLNSTPMLEYGHKKVNTFLLII